MAIIPMFPYTILHFFFDSNKFFIITQQIDQQSSWIRRRRPQTSTTSHQPLHPFNQLMPESVRRNSHLFQILMSHFGQDIQSYLFPFEYLEEVFQIQAESNRINDSVKLLNDLRFTWLRSCRHSFQRYSSPISDSSSNPQEPVVINCYD